MNKSEAVNTLLDWCGSWIGYVEKASNNNLSSMTGNAGANNYTIFADDLSKTDILNGNKNGYAWCACFVIDGFYKCFGSDACKKMLYLPNKSLAAGCSYGAKYYKAKGKLLDSPEPGDQIFFGAPGSEYHTGIVVKVDGNRVYTIEGNTGRGSVVIANGGTVCGKSYVINKDQMRFGRPDWSVVANVVIETAPSTPAASTGNPTLRKGDKGADVKKAQTLLIDHGVKLPKYGADGDFGSETFEAVKAFQYSKGLEVDGIIGKNTWAVLLKAPEVTRETIRRGDKGVTVTEAQKLLMSKGYALPKYGADGDFGAETESAVKQFQKNERLEIDGIVGRNTWTALTK